MKTLIQNEVAGVLVYSHPDYKGDTIYVVCYGLDVKKTESLQETMMIYGNCLEHYKNCVSPVDEPEEMLK